MMERSGRLGTIIRFISPHNGYMVRFDEKHNKFEPDEVRVQSVNMTPLDRKLHDEWEARWPKFMDRSWAKKAPITEPLRPPSRPPRSRPDTKATTEAASPETRALFDRISKNGIRIDLAGVQARIQEYQSREALSIATLDGIFDFHNLRAKFPSHIKPSETHFNPGSKRHINAWLLNNGEEETHSISMENLRVRLPAKLATAIIEAKQLRKARSDLEIMERHTDPDGRVRVSWSVAATGRWYTGEPPIQTLAKVVREYLKPDEGNVFYTIDWKSQELHLIAKLAQEPSLLKTLSEGGDPHKLAYEKVTGKTMPEGGYAKEDARNTGKMLNYALIYGIPPKNLAARLDISVEEAQKLIDAYFLAFPHIKAWRDKQYDEVQTGHVTTLDGRVIPITIDEPRRDDDYGKRLVLEKAQRKAVNYMTQGSAADQLTQALHNIADTDDARFDHVRATIHDAILIEVPRGAEGKKIADWFNDIMTKPFHGQPSPADTKGPSLSWAEVMDEIIASDEVPEDLLNPNVVFKEPDLPPATTSSSTSQRIPKPTPVEAQHLIAELKQDFPNYRSTLTSKQRIGLSRYKSPQYQAMNQTLITGQLVPYSNFPIQEQVDDLISAFENPDSTLKQDQILYRGIADWQEHLGKVELSALVGAEIEEKGFVSTTLNSGTASQFAAFGKVEEETKRHAVFKITARKGQKVVPISAYYSRDTEAEVLLPPGTRYRVTAAYYGDAQAARAGFQKRAIIEVEVL